MTTGFGKHHRKDFSHHSGLTPLNHGSYGAYPNRMKPVIQQYQQRIEESPDLWYRVELQDLIEKNVKCLSKYVKCKPEDLAFVQTASDAVNTVLRSFPFKQGDKVLCYHTAFISIDKTLEFLKYQYGVKLIKIQLDYPLEDDEIIRATQETIDREPDICMAVFDAISSLPGVRFPFEAINTLVQSHGILSLIDGAHSIGHIELDLEALDPDFFISNCYKWLYTPRNSAVLYVPKRNQGWVHPIAINHEYQHHEERGDCSSFKKEIEYPGPYDSIPYLLIQEALEYRDSIGGEEAIREYCHNIAVEGGALVAKLLGTHVMENSTKTLTANMVNVELPPFKTTKTDAEVDSFFTTESLYRHQIMLPVYKNNSKWWVRLSGQVYVDLDDFERAAEAITAIIQDLDETS